MCVAKDHTLFFTHDKSYGGYVIDIQSKSEVKLVKRDNIDNEHQKFMQIYNRIYHDQNTKVSCEDITKNAAMEYAQTAQTLKSVKDTIVVFENESSIEFSGGLTISKLRNPKFALVPNPDPNAGADASKVIAQDRDAMDVATLGIAGFVHYHPTGCKGGAIQWWCTHIAYTLGLGFSTGNTALNAFIGPSFRTRDGSWFVTLGYNIGPRDRLPSGNRIGEPPASPNDLNNLASHTAGGMFIALSYAFAKPHTSYFTNAFNTNPPAATKPSNNGTSDRQ